MDGISPELGYAWTEICRGREYVMDGKRLSVSMEAATIFLRVAYC
jgi:hypothetical protein